MNLLEHYIEEVHEIKEVTHDDMTFISADLTVNCYGSLSRVKTTFMNMKEWEFIKEQGFYLG